jgi:hypothetical protein
MDIILQLPVYLVIYTESIFIESLKQKRELYGFRQITQFIEMEFKDMWGYSYLEKVKANREVYFPTRDSRTCAESHIITCNKFDFVLQTIYSNPFNTNKFGWIDAFLGKDNKMRICEDYTVNLFLDVLHNITDKFHIQILNVNDKKYKLPEHKSEYYSTYQYVVCGGFFTCGKEIGIKILNKLKESFIETTLQGFGHGEEMLYLNILDDFYDDIEKSYGDYGQMINNFINPTRNIHYIYYLVIKRYLDFGYNKECYDCCKKVLYSIEKLNASCGVDTYFLILFSYYISSFYHKQSETLQILNHIMNLIQTNPNIQAEYEKNKDFYNSQFKYGYDLRPHYKLVVCVFACATVEKYKNEILKINETWGKLFDNNGSKLFDNNGSKLFDNNGSKLFDNNGGKLLYFLGEDQTDLIDNNKYIYLKNVKNDYESASHKQNLGLKYIYENYNADFVFCCGTDTYINIEKIMQYLNGFNSNEKLYIGGHGTNRQIGNQELYFHSGGAGFILSNNALMQIYPKLNTMVDTWKQICFINNRIDLIGACDVCIAYSMNEINAICIKNNNFYSCNYKGYAYSNTYMCCCHKIQLNEIITCHNMTLQDFDEYTQILHDNHYFIV